MPKLLRPETPWNIVAGPQKNELFLKKVFAKENFGLDTNVGLNEVLAMGISTISFLADGDMSEQDHIEVTDWLLLRQGLDGLKNSFRNFDPGCCEIVPTTKSLICPNALIFALVYGSKNEPYNLSQAETRLRMNADSFPDYSFTAMRGNKIVGGISCFPRLDALCIDSVHVSPEFQGRRIGNRLIRHVLDKLSENPSRFNHLELLAQESDTPFRWYLRNRLTKTGLRLYTYNV